MRLLLTNPCMANGERRIWLTTARCFEAQRFLVDDQAVHQGAKLQEGVPIAAITRQA